MRDDRVGEDLAHLVNPGGTATAPVMAALPHLVTQPLHRLQHTVNYSLGQGNSTNCGTKREETLSIPAFG